MPHEDLKKHVDHSQDDAFKSHRLTPEEAAQIERELNEPQPIEQLHEPQRAQPEAQQPERTDK